MKAIAEKIGRLDDASVERIVRRIPESYLPAHVAANIIQNLAARRIAPEIAALAA